MIGQVEPKFARDNLGSDADDVYSGLTAAHEGLSLEQSHRLNTRLVLMMMNTIGDAALLQHLFVQARQTIDQDSDH